MCDITTHKVVYARIRGTKLQGRLDLSGFCRFESTEKIFVRLSKKGSIESFDSFPGLFIRQFS